MKEWEKQTIREYADLMTLDFCLNCDLFVCGKSGDHYDHDVARIKL